MTFDEAMTAVQAGEIVRRTSWAVTTVALQAHCAVVFNADGSYRRQWFLCSNFGDMAGRYVTPFAIEAEGVNATDWEIVK